VLAANKSVVAANTHRTSVSATIAILIRKASLLGLPSAQGSQLVMAAESWTRVGGCLISGVVLLLAHLSNHGIKTALKYAISHHSCPFAREGATSEKLWHEPPPKVRLGKVLY
jgi:hypothetical protein